MLGSDAESEVDGERKWAGEADRDEEEEDAEAEEGELEEPDMPTTTRDAI